MKPFSGSGSSWLALHISPAVLRSHSCAYNGVSAGHLD